jgi:hypothetical protein
MSNDPLLQRAFNRTWTRRGFRTSDWDAALSGPVRFFPSTPSPNNRKAILLPLYWKPPFGGAPPNAYKELVLPYWLVFFSVAALASAPWIHWRFSLRTLLIAMTLVAILLGLIVYAAR